MSPSLPSPSLPPSLSLSLLSLPLSGVTCRGNSSCVSVSPSMPWDGNPLPPVGDPVGVRAPAPAQNIPWYTVQLQFPGNAPQAPGGSHVPSLPRQGEQPTQRASTSRRPGAMSRRALLSPEHLREAGDSGPTRGGSAAPGQSPHTSPLPGSDSLAGLRFAGPAELSGWWRRSPGPFTCHCWAQGSGGPEGGGGRGGFEKERSGDPVAFPTTA